MIRITDFSGNDLVANPPPPLSVSSVNGVATVNIQCLVSEQGTLPYSYSTGTLSWDDGSLPVVFNSMADGTIVVNATKVLGAGDYLIQVQAHNYATPTWGTASVNFNASVNPAPVAPAPYLYGPILPKDSGYPNASQWDFASSVDLDILASSVKMLLTTTPGDRIMNPQYGSSLRQLLFQPNTVGLENLARQAITTALAAWEPRVTIQELTVQQIGDTAIQITATFVSKINQQTFTLQLPYSA